MSFMPQTKETLLAEQAYEAFRELLINGKIRSGQMVSMAELTELTLFAMGPIREAVKRAAALGLVKILPKRGVVVLEATAESLQACFHMRYLFDQEGARIISCNPAKDELLQLRLEHQSVLNEALHAPITETLQIQAMNIDWELHLYLARALDNSVAFEAYEENRDRINVMQYSRLPLPERIIPAMNEHIHILNTLIDGSPEQAMEAVRTHLRQTLRWWGILQAPV